MKLHSKYILYKIIIRTIEWNGQQKIVCVCVCSCACINSSVTRIWNKHLVFVNTVYTYIGQRTWVKLKIEQTWAFGVIWTRECALLKSVITTSLRCYVPCGRAASNGGVFLEMRKGLYATEKSIFFINFYRRCFRENENQKEA